MKFKQCFSNKLNKWAFIGKYEILIVVRYIFLTSLGWFVGSYKSFHDNLSFKFKRRFISETSLITFCVVFSYSVLYQHVEGRLTSYIITIVTYYWSCIYQKFTNKVHRRYINVAIVFTTPCHRKVSVQCSIILIIAFQQILIMFNSFILIFQLNQKSKMKKF